MRKDGFTLIELMIVIAIIAIIAAIAIPNLLTGRISANETSAIAGLKTLASQEAIWRQGDLDGNGMKDYWTYDVSCFHRMYRADGTTKVNLIDISFARADAFAATPDGMFGNGAMEPWSGGNTAISIQAKSGYWYTRLVTTFIGSGSGYQVNTTGNGVNACHNSLFGFAAGPETYGSSGINMFVMDQGGTVYSTDPGTNSTFGAAGNWNCGPAAANPFTWPATTSGGSPTSSNGPGGRKWTPAE